MIPDKIKIGGITYTVKIEELERLDNGDWQFGITDYPSCTITINSKITKERQEQTFFHELMHAVFLESSNQEQSNDERLVDSVGLLLYQMYKETNNEN